MPEAGSEFDLRLNKSVPVAVERYEQYLLHFVRELSEAPQGGGRDWGQHLRAQKLQDFLRDTER